MLFQKVVTTTLLSMASLLTFTGCGNGLDSTVPVSGVLTYKGQALAHYQVDFLPDDSTKRPAGAITDADGKFVLGTNQPGDGAVPGMHKVAITFIGADGPVVGIDPASNPTAAAPRAKVALPAKYEDPNLSEIAFEIGANGAQDLKIELK